MQTGEELQYRSLAASRDGVVCWQRRIRGCKVASRLLRRRTRCSEVHSWTADAHTLKDQISVIS
jgi:hypothetical protein